MTGAGLAHLGKLTVLHDLDLSRTRVGDAGLAHLAGLSLRTLDLRGTLVRGAGLAHLGKRPPDAAAGQGNERRAMAIWLDFLDLGGTPLTDEGLPHLAKLKGINLLDLSGTRISDAGLVHLKDLSWLKMLDLSHTAITDRGLDLLSEGNHLDNLYNLYLGETLVTEAMMKTVKRRFKQNVDISKQGSAKKNYQKNCT